MVHTEPSPTATPVGSAPAVVGIGAPGADLEALRAFVRAIDPAAPVAYVVTGLDEAGVAAAAALAGECPLPITKVGDRVAIRAGRIHVAPAAGCAIVLGGALRVVDHVGPGVRAPIDRLFRSLAEEQGARAIGVLLAGGGVDGLIGIARLRDAGALTMVQEPQDARDDRLPCAAIATGMIDRIAAAGELARTIANVVGTAAAPDLESHEDVVREVLAVLKSRTGHDFSGRRKSDVAERIARRVQLCERVDLRAYASFLRVHGTEVAALDRALIGRVASFFPDPETIQAIERDVIPALISRTTERVRIWVPGCATGEEAYSIAMLVAERTSYLRVDPRVQIFATDRDGAALAVARAGAYPETIAYDVGGERIERFFRKDGSAYVVKKELREKVLFSQHDLLRDPPFSRMDLVYCRGTLGRLTRDAQDHALALCHFALRNGGHLVVGDAEYAETVSLLFARASEDRPIYVRRAGAAPLPGRDRPPTVTELERAAIDHYVVPFVLIDADGELVHLAPGAERYLDLSAGPRTLALVRTCKPAFRLELTSALEAMAHGRPGEARIVRAELDGQSRLIQLTLRRVPGGQRDLIRVAFEELEGVPRLSWLERDGAEAPPEGDEVRTLRARLERTLAEYEAASKELRASNEWLHRYNEELQAATEELESSKEDLQAVNEEVVAINADLHDKVGQLARANADLQNLMAATDLAVIFLDRELCITRFTPRARELYSVIDADVGRSLAHLVHALDVDVPALAARVLESLDAVEQPARARDGRHFVVAVRPYRTLAGEVGGIVIKFVEVTRYEEAQRAARESERRFRFALRTAPVVMTSQDAQLRYTWGYTLGGDADFIGKTDADLFQPVEAAALEQWKRAVLATGISRRAEAPLTTGGVTRHYELNLEPIVEGGVVTGVACAAFDVTPAKLAELALRDADRRKDEFLATLAHELRNPLAPLRAALDLQELAGDDLTRLHRARKVMDRQVTQLVRLVDDLLDVSRITQGKIQLRFGWARLGAIVAEAVEAVSAQVAAAGHSLDVAIEPEVEVECDVARVTQVITNLLSNAIKYTPRGGHLAVASAHDDATVTLRVKDDGIGIAPDVLPHIFDLFTQADDAEPHAQGGLGIGLNLVRRLVELHGGEVVARSEGTGRGSELVVRLPRAQKEAHMMQAQEHRMSIKPGLARRVLVVDDNEDVTDTIGEVVRMIGHEVEIAHDGLEALRVAETYRPDTVLLDIGMPGMSGYEVARRLRQTPGGDHLLLVAITGWGQTHDRELSDEAGFDHHLVKPAALATLRELLGTVG